MSRRGKIDEYGIARCVCPARSARLGDGQSPGGVTTSHVTTHSTHTCTQPHTAHPHTWAVMPSCLINKLQQLCLGQTIEPVTVNCTCKGPGGRSFPTFHTSDGSRRNNAPHASLGITHAQAPTMPAACKEGRRGKTRESSRMARHNSPHHRSPACATASPPSSPSPPAGPSPPPARRSPTRSPRARRARPDHGC